MYYEAELRLLRETFRKSRISTGICDPSTIREDQKFDQMAFLSGDADPAILLRHVLPEVEAATVYRLRDPFDCRYIFLQLPETANKVLVIGPYLAAAPTQRQVLEFAEHHGISPSRQKNLFNYIYALPLLPDNSQLYMLLEAFYEYLWGASSFTVEYMDWDPYPTLPILNQKSDSDVEEDTLFTMKNMEKR